MRRLDSVFALNFDRVGGGSPSKTSCLCKRVRCRVVAERPATATFSEFFLSSSAKIISRLNDEILYTLDWHLFGHACNMKGILVSLCAEVLETWGDLKRTRGAETRDEEPRGAPDK